METHTHNHSKTEEKKDRRIGRTQQLLREALESLILEKPYPDITVQDIIDRANVGRSTFYAHYLDKDHLFKTNIERLRDLLHEQYRQAILKAYQNSGGHNREKARFEATLFLFQHAQSYQTIYKALVGKPGGEWIHRQFEETFSGILRQHIAELAPDQSPPGVPQEVLVQYMASALMGLLTWWLENNSPYTAEQMNTWFHSLTMRPLFSQ